MTHLLNRAAPEFLKQFIIEKAPAVILKDNKPIEIIDNKCDAFVGAADGLSVTSGIRLVIQLSIIRF